MNQKLTCPDRNELIRYNSGELPSDIEDSVSDHILKCKRCQTNLSELPEHSQGIGKNLARIRDTQHQRARQAMQQQANNKTPRPQKTSPKIAAGSTTHSVKSKTSLSPGQTLNQYQILRLIGSGGMGEVYEAQHAVLENRVAFKVIREKHQDNPISHDYLLKEIKTGGKFEHPNLVKTIDGWVADGCYYMVQEFLNGSSLQTLVDKRAFGGLQEVLDAIYGICRGLEYLHARRIIHRDIKPANIMRLTDGTIKVIDFGLAVSFGEIITHPGAGTRGFMAPEQSTANTAAPQRNSSLFAGFHNFVRELLPRSGQPNQSLDHRADIYSTGRVLLYLLVKVPDDLNGKRKQRASKQLHRLAKCMTEENPALRPQDIQNVISRLDNIQRDLLRSRVKTVLQASAIAVVIAFCISLFLMDYGENVGVNGNQAPVQADLQPELDAKQQKANDNPANITVTGHDQLTVRIEDQPAKPAADSQVNSGQPTRQPFKLKTVEIPAGRFVMGASEGDIDALANESPRRTVEFSEPFRMSAHEITVGQFRQFVEAMGYRTEAEISGKGGWKATQATSFGMQTPEFNWSNPGYPVTDSHPVTMVTYADAMAFCDWLSKRDDGLYRLPTETEWEYACRAGTSTAYHFSFEARDAYCWSHWNVKDTVEPRPVGTRQPNAWGLFDMSGNVREWCLDWYSEDAYRQDFTESPAGPAEGTMRSVRGGCFIDLNPFLRSSHRGYIQPLQALNTQGFRIVEGPVPVAKLGSSTEMSDLGSQLPGNTPRDTGASQNIVQSPVIAGQWLEDDHAVQVQQRGKHFIARSRYMVKDNQAVEWAMSGTVETDGSINAQLGMMNYPPGWPGIQTLAGKLQDNGSIQFSVTSYRRGAVPEPEAKPIVWMPNGPRTALTSDALTSTNISGQWTTGGLRPEPIDFTHVGEDIVAFLRYEHEPGPVWWVQVGTFTQDGDYDGVLYHSIAPAAYPIGYWRGHLDADGMIRGTGGDQPGSSTPLSLERVSDVTTVRPPTMNSPTRSSIQQSAPTLLAAPFSTADIRTARQGWSKSLGLPETITIGASRNQSCKLELVLIPPGTFEMGMPETLSLMTGNKAEWAASSKPARRVTITRPFYFSRYEVTQKQFRDVMGGGKTPVDGDGTQLPATQIGWQACVEFCERLTASGENMPKGSKLRLPTEAEWEYACRAGTTSRFWSGDQIGPNQASLRIGGRKMQLEPVGSFQPNPFGLYNMHGNVAEWCSDWFSPGSYASSGKVDPKGLANGSHKVIRGGGYSNPPFSATSYWRQSYEPGTRSGNIGLRPVLELPAR